MDAERSMIERCLKKEEAAERQLYDMYAGIMYAICLRYGGNSTEAKDIMQEGFYRVYKNLHTFRLKGSLEGWIRKIIINTCINYKRNQRKFLVEVDLENAGDHEAIPEGSLSRYTEEELFRILKKLPIVDQSVFCLHVVEEASHKEIGLLLNISEASSKSLYIRAKTKIQTIIGRMENSELQSVAY